jgi:poly-beta-1,6-N-acetyl-D-glucosamine synthase
MAIYFFIVFGVYFSIVIALVVGWQIALEQPKNKKTGHKFSNISVIVPYRNEEKKLPSLLNSLLAQHYPIDNLEIILVNDHSTDGSERVVEEYAYGRPQIISGALDVSRTGKKQALSFGIAQAKGEIIVTTDADCNFSTQWVSKINEVFTDHHCKMAIGAVNMQPNSSFFSRLQAMEFASLIGVAAATVSYSAPTLCNGANLAFLKTVFIEVDGYAGNLHIPSGDDEFLMRKIIAKHPGGITFLNDGESVVSTQPASSVSEFLQQRIRWAGKWKANPSIVSRLLAVFVFLFQLSYLGAGVCVAFEIVSLDAFLILVIGKFLLEFIFLYQVSVFLKIRWRWISFIALQLIYPFYVLWVGLMAQRQSVKWKDRVMTHRGSV